MLKDGQRYFCIENPKDIVEISNAKEYKTIVKTSWISYPRGFEFQIMNFYPKSNRQAYWKLLKGQEAPQEL